jgi:hypothetical protein
VNDNSTQTDIVQRNSYMTALSLAEQLISEAQTLPTEFTITAQPWTPDEPRIGLYFHDDIPGLRQFRDDQMLTESMATRADGSVYIEAVRTVRGVRVTAWTLVTASAVEQVALPVRPVEVTTLAAAVAEHGPFPMPAGPLPGELADERPVSVEDAEAAARAAVNRSVAAQFPVVAAFLADERSADDRRAESVAKLRGLLARQTGGAL